MVSHIVREFIGNEVKSRMCSSAYGYEDRYNRLISGKLENVHKHTNTDAINADTHLAQLGGQ